MCLNEYYFYCIKKKILIWFRAENRENHVLRIYLTNLGISLLPTRTGWNKVKLKLNSNTWKVGVHCLHRWLYKNLRSWFCFFRTWVKMSNLLLQQTFREEKILYFVRLHIFLSVILGGTTCTAGNLD